MNVLGTVLRKKGYLGLTLAILISGVGTAFTAIAVYAELSRLKAAPLFYAGAFLLGLVPGLFTSLWSAKLVRRFSVVSLFTSLQLLGALALVLPLLGLLYHQVPLLLVAELIGSSIGGFMAPLYQTYLRKTFTDEELPAASVWDVYLFSANFVIGQALGTLLYSFVTPQTFLLVDIFSYVAAALLIQMAAKWDPSGFRAESNEKAASPFRWAGLTPGQKRVFWFMPLLALSCAPSMALLPARGAEFGDRWQWGVLSLTPAVVVILFRTLGQLTAPLLLKRLPFEAMLKKDGLIVGCLLFYLALYRILFTLPSFPAVLACVFLAHVASNIIYALASYGFTRHFTGETIGAAAARHYQASVLFTSAGALLGGYLADHFPLEYVSYFSLIPVLLMVAHLAYAKTATASRRKGAAAHGI